MILVGHDRRLTAELQQRQLVREHEDCQFLFLQGAPPVGNVRGHLLIFALHGQGRRDRLPGIDQDPASPAVADEDVRVLAGLLGPKLAHPPSTSRASSSGSDFTRFCMVLP